MGPAEPDPLSDLRDRLRETHEAAARLAGGEPRLPPQGWAAPPRSEAGGNGAAAGSGSGSGDERAQLVALLGSLRELVPPELQQEVTDLIRQVLVLVRAVLDLAIERLEPGRGEEPDVQDIPIA